MRVSAQFPRESSNDSSRLKKRGNLAATLDPLLEPRLALGRRGRPKGARNYTWTPERDKLLVEICCKSGPAKAKRILGLKIQEDRHVETPPRPDTVRKAVERRMVQLGLANETTRKKFTPFKQRR